MDFIIDYAPFIFFASFMIFIVYFILKSQKFQKQAMTKTKDALTLQEEAFERAQAQAQAGLDKQQEAIKLMEKSNKLLSEILAELKK